MKKIGIKYFGISIQSYDLFEPSKTNKIFFKFKTSFFGKYKNLFAILGERPDGVPSFISFRFINGKKFVSYYIFLKNGKVHRKNGPAKVYTRKVRNKDKVKTTKELFFFEGNRFDSVEHMELAIACR